MRMSLMAYQSRVFCFSMFLGVCAFFLLGCSSARVVKGSPQYSGILKPPQFIYVQLFDVDGGTWLVDREGRELGEFKKAISGHLQEMMLERFLEIAPTDMAPKKLPGTGLLVAGEFTYVEQGSRALRAVVGMGAGGTKVKTVVRLYDLSVSNSKPVVIFSTTGGSNAQPGLLTGGGFTIGGVSSAVMNVYGLDDDLKRTAREVRNFILHKKTVQDYFRP
jgi:hypothetical protein